MYILLPLQKGLKYQPNVISSLGMSWVVSGIIRIVNFHSCIRDQLFKCLHHDAVYDHHCVIKNNIYNSFLLNFFGGIG